MSFASLCRVCLSTKQLETIANTQLQTIFEKLTSNQLIGDGRPESVCYECHQLLQKCCKFVNQSLRSERFLSQFFCSNDELTKKLTIQNYIPHTLAVSKTILMSIPGDDENSILFVKYEPEETKWEVKIDIENPVKIDNIKTTNEIDSMEAKQIDTFDYDGGLDTYIAPITTPTQKPVDVPMICDDKIPDVYDSIEAETLEQESTFADKDSDSSNIAKDPTTPQQGIIKHEYPKQHKKTNEIDLKDMTKTLIMRLEPPKSKKNTYNCSKCPKVFKQKAYLKRHIRTHTGEKPYACVICSETFTDSVILKQHIRTHNGEAPYTCHVCSKEFNQKPHLAEHIRTHTGEKPYVCETCSCTFSHRSSLKRHMRTHSGEKPYICHKCPRQFSQISNLKKHILSCKVDKNTHVCVKCLQ